MPRPGATADKTGATPNGARSIVSPSNIFALGCPAYFSPAHDLQHAVGGLVILLLAAILGLYKPQALTSYGRRKKEQLRARGDDPRPAVRDLKSPAG